MNIWPNIESIVVSYIKRRQNHREEKSRVTILGVLSQKMMLKDPKNIDKGKRKRLIVLKENPNKTRKMQRAPTNTSLQQQ